MQNSTGKIVDEVREGDRIVRGTQDQFIQTHELKFNKDTGFVKLYNGAASELYRLLSQSELSIFFQLVDYVGYDGLLRDHKKVLCMSDIAKIVGMNYSTVRKIMPKLERKGIFKSTTVMSDTRKKQKSYLANPYILFRGVKIELSVLEIFKDTDLEKRISKADRHYEAR